LLHCEGLAGIVGGKAPIHLLIAHGIDLVCATWLMITPTEPVNRGGIRGLPELMPQYCPHLRRIRASRELHHIIRA
jgi:hypothetical protein